MPTKSKGLLHIRDFPIYKRATHWNNNEKRHETRTQQIISEKIVQYEDFHLVISSLSETHVKLSGQCSCVSSPKWKTCNQNWKCYRKKDETNQRLWWNQRTECWIQTDTHTVPEWKPRSDRDRWTYSTILKSDYCSTSFHSRAIVVWFFSVLISSLHCLHWNFIWEEKHNVQIENSHTYYARLQNSIIWNNNCRLCCLCDRSVAKLHILPLMPRSVFPLPRV